MNYTNFNKTYVSNGFAGSSDNVLLWKHENGTVAQIDMFWEDNYVFISFVDGITLDVSLKGSVVKVGLHDEVRTRDLGTHPSWNGPNRKTLVKLWLRRVLGQKTTEEQREAIYDIVLNEFVI